MRRRVIALLACCSFGLCASPLRAEDWDPSATHAVVAGVLEWQENRISGFSKRNRKDQELRETLVQRGVPAAQATLLLDADATRDKVLTALTAACRKAGPGSTLLFYYCGHGGPCGNRDACLMNYDIQPRQPLLTGLLVSEIGERVARDFKGKRVLFLADCCYSGGLGRAADRLTQAGFEVASLTSAADNTSTVNWTFTQTVIDALRGDPLGDHDADGAVTFAELVAEVADGMSNLEGQHHGILSHKFPKSLVLSRSKKSDAAAGVTAGGYKVRDFVVAQEGGRQRPGRVVGVRGGKLVVQFFDYSEKRTAEYEPASVQRAPVGGVTRLPVEAVNGPPAGGTITGPVANDGVAEFEVEWTGTWWPARAVKKEGNRTLIHYVGWSADEDEWVTAERMRPLPGKVAVAPPAPPQPVEIEVEWNGTWYPATVIRRDGEKALIHYDNYGDNWDEWVTPARMRPRQKQ